MSFRVGQLTMLVAALALLASGRSAQAKVHERDIQLTGSGNVCDHSMNDKKVTLRQNANQARKKKDVLVWHVINDCDKDLMVALCVADNVLDTCAVLPRALAADVNMPFVVKADERVSLACRGASLGLRKVQLKTGDNVHCGGIAVLTHAIDIEIAP